MSSTIRVGLAGMLLWALLPNPYAYYTLLRWLVCAGAVYLVVLSLNQEKHGWAGAFGLIALLFNPVLPVYLDRATWAPVDIVAAVVFFASLDTIKEPAPNGATSGFTTCPHCGKTSPAGSTRCQRCRRPFRETVIEESLDSQRHGEDAG